MSVGHAILQSMKTRRARRTKSDDVLEIDDPHGPFQDSYASFLEHARWVVEVQERRGAGFQQTAVAVLGFDGVILTILISLRPSWDSLASNLVTGFAALFVVVSGIFAVLALVPRGVVVADTEQLLDQWAAIFEPPPDAPIHPTATRAALAASLQSRDLEVVPAPRSRWSRRWRRPSGRPLQPIQAAEDLANTRAAHLKRAAWFLVVGLATVVAAWLTSLGTDTLTN